MEKDPYQPPDIIEEKSLGLARLTEIVEGEPEFAFAKELGDSFPEAGVYLVGGSVRDVVLDRPSKDYDFIVCGVAPAALEKFLAERGDVNLVGRNFGVYKFRPRSTVNGQLSTVEIDIALPRRDIAAGTGGYRDVDTQSDPNMPVEEDLARRDFTFNAMAWDVRMSRLVDPHEGLLDLLDKKVRSVGVASERFREDYSRMLRGLRMAAAFGFGFEMETWEAIKSEMKHINDVRKNAAGKTERVVPHEVIGREFLKSLKAEPARTMDLWDESGAIGELIPELLKMKGCEQPKEYHSEGDVWVHTRLALTKLSSPEFKELFGEREPSVEVKLAVLLHDVGKPLAMQTPEKDGVPRISFIGHDKIGAPAAEAIAERLKLASVEGMNVSPARIKWLVEEHLFAHNVDPMEAKATTLKKRFFNPNYDGTDLLMVAFVDAAAAERPDGTVDTARVKEYLQKIAEMKEKFGAERRVKPLLNGDEVMKILGLKPGPEVRKALELLIDAQAEGKIATREEAEEYLKQAFDV